MFSKLVDYIKGTKAELKSVNWPTKKQTTDYTLLVVGISLFVALLLGFFDNFFSFLLQKFVL
ncbi:MAG: preprotein translocase subunit SecE [Candidatus Marinimicrobia bacterium]|nr:preprotein translocase subunit SecE [Candidatus Neomarinimicrobiota bacterium]